MELTAKGYLDHKTAEFIEHLIKMGYPDIERCKGSLFATLDSVYSHGMLDGYTQAQESLLKRIKGE